TSKRDREDFCADEVAFYWFAIDVYLYVERLGSGDDFTEGVAATAQIVRPIGFLLFGAPFDQSRDNAYSECLRAEIFVFEPVHGHQIEGPHIIDTPLLCELLWRAGDAQGPRDIIRAAEWHYTDRHRPVGQVGKNIGNRPIASGSDDEVPRILEGVLDAVILGRNVVNLEISQAQGIDNAIFVVPFRATRRIVNEEHPNGAPTNFAPPRSFLADLRLGLNLDTERV